MGSESHGLSSAIKPTHADSHVSVSSSPELPSIGDLVTRAGKKPAIRSTSRITTAPETASKAFITAFDLWHSNLAGIHDDSFPDISDFTRPSLDNATRQAVLSAPNVSLAPVATSEESPSISASPEVIVQKITATRARKPRVKQSTTTTVVAEEGAPAKPKRQRKAKAQDINDGQTTLPKGKVTKAMALKLKQSRKRSETVSKHFAKGATLATIPDEILEALDPIEEPIELDPALARRIDWTPTKDTASLTISLVSSPSKGSVALEPTGTSFSTQPTNDLFTTLRDTYGCAGHEERRKTSPMPVEAVDVLRKRKLIEMVTTGGSKSPSVSPTKPKAKTVKKKPRTITELATAAYRVQEPVQEGQGDEDFLLNYFSVEQETGFDSKTTATKPSKTTRPGTKPKPKRATKKKVEVQKPSLLSPASALRQVSRQDFVFGTSSQLATEEDAGLLRDIQQAMIASNQQDDDGLDNLFASSPLHDALTRNPTRKLWAAGARDVDGDLLQVEVINLVDDPAMPEDLTNPDDILSLVEPQKARPPIAEQQKVLETETVAGVNVISLSSSPTLEPHAEPQLHFLSRQKETASSSMIETVNSIAAVTPRMAASSVLLTDFSDWDDEPPASNQEQFLTSQAVKAPKKSINRPKRNKVTHQAPGSPTAASVTVEDVPPATSKPVPKFEACSDAQLAKEVQRYGFKPIKRRAAAIALLTECWLSKNKALGTTASLSTSSKPSAKAATTTTAPKPRGRPRKDTMPAAEVSPDASAPAEPTKKPRGRPRKDTTTAAATTTATKRAAKATAEPVPRPSTPKGRKKSSPPRDFVEIADSEDEAMDGFVSSPSPSLSLSPEPVNEFSSPSAVDVSMTEDDSLTATPTDDQAALFRRITDAVTSAPRSKDPENPSWHEKMLMYDPVVLEDLTAWLNGGQLDRVGWDGEASTADVKKWCESRSICCLWKVTNNGRDRARF